ncbi:hypothetical protein ADK18_01440, partial [Bacillus anthracis]
VGRRQATKNTSRFDLCFFVFIFIYQILMRKKNENEGIESNSNDFLLFKFSKCSKCSQTILIIGTVISTTSIYFK